MNKIALHCYIRKLLFYFYAAVQSTYAEDILYLCVFRNNAVPELFIVIFPVPTCIDLSIKTSLRKSFATKPEVSVYRQLRNQRSF